MLLITFFSCRAIRCSPLWLCDKIHGVVGQSDTLVAFETLCILLTEQIQLLSGPRFGTDGIDACLSQMLKCCQRSAEPEGFEIVIRFDNRKLLLCCMEQELKS